MKYFLVFSISWWIILFMVLPIGIKGSSNSTEKGHDAGAPIDPKMKQKFIITTFIATLILLIFIYLDNEGYTTKFFLGDV